MRNDDRLGNLINWSADDPLFAGWNCGGNTGERTLLGGAECDRYRGDNEPIRIGKGANVQDGCVLHTDPGFPMTIEEGCTIGHLVMLHGCTIKRGSLVGIGAIVLNGAEIGEDCLIGAHALVPEGKVIPPRSVVMGTPGKIVREVSEADLTRMRMSAEEYQRNWKRYANGLKPQ